MDQSVLQKYTKTFGCRFTRAQKNKFLHALHEDMNELGYESVKIPGKKGLSKAENYLFGNVKQIKTLIVVPYDTPEKKFWHKVLYYPMDGSKTASKTMAATYVPLVVLFAIIFVAVYIIQPRIQADTSTSLIINTIISIVTFALTITMVYLMLHGAKNKHNVNRNSATIAEVMRIASMLNKDERKRVGFLFTDKNKLRFIGAEASVKYLNENSKNPTIIYLDCIGKGSKTCIGFNPQNRKLATEITKSYPDKKSLDVMKLNEDMRLQSAMSFFRKAVIISSGDMDEQGNLYVLGTGTGKDTNIDETLLDKTGDMIYTFIHTQK